MRGARWLAYMDDTHGQAHWGQTGFPSRELHTHYTGLAGVLSDLGADCSPIHPRLLPDVLAHARLLVLPPPTGRYDPLNECWHGLASSRLSPKEVQSLLDFLQAGGRLLALAYRFGDVFTGANLQELFTLLGCTLHNDVVIDVTRLRDTHPLQFHFDVTGDLLPLPWSWASVSSVRWRALATFTIRTGAPVQPLALSPGGRCISFDCVQRRISFQSRPIAVAGTFGRGRFVLFGGPHAFETGPLGLLDEASNRHFLRNVLSWLLNDQGDTSQVQQEIRQPDLEQLNAVLTEQWRDVCEVEETGGGADTVAFVEHLLHQTGVLKALSRPSWMP